VGEDRLEGRLMALWCRDLPTVTPRQAAVPKPVTLIVPFYENPQFLADQIAIWQGYRPELAALLRIIVVDDGSPTTAAAEVARRQDPHRRLNLRVFRIGVDIRWNWLAARNIGFHHAADGWCLVTDIDHVVPEATLERCLQDAHDPAVVYAFARREHTGQRIHPHSASFLMTRTLFWRIGGYDEALSGYYGTDGEFRRRVAKAAPLQLLPYALVRHEFVADSSTRRYLRKQPEDARVRQLVAARRTGWKPRALSFPYEDQTPC
jgi:glycosyltransferase involved in cell wall biosynthesis